jgi:hypothetical protein
MRTLEHFQVQHFVPIEDGEVHCFRSFFRELPQHRAADLAKRGVIGDSGAKSSQLGPHYIGTRVVTEEIAFAFQMGDESVSRAFVEASLLRNLPQLQSGR